MFKPCYPGSAIYAYDTQFDAEGHVVGVLRGRTATTPQTITPTSIRRRRRTPPTPTPTALPNRGLPQRRSLEFLLGLPGPVKHIPLF